MANATLAFDILTKYRDAGARKAAGDMDKLGKSSTRMGSSLKKAAKVGAVAMGAGVVLASRALVGMTKSAIADDAAQKRLALALKNNAHATKGQVASVEDWITAQGKAYGVTDDDLRPALMKLVGATHDVGKAQKLASLAMDISAGTGKSLSTVTQALMKAQNGQVAGLSKLGIKTQDSVKDQAALESANIAVRKAQEKYNEALKNSGRGSKEAKDAALELEYRQTKLGEAQGKAKKTTIDFAEAQKRLADTFGGQAGKQANTLQGKMQRLKVQYDETKEAIGYRLIPVLSSLADIVFTKVIPGIGATSDFLRRHKSLLIAVTGAVATLVAGVLIFNVASSVAAAVTKTVTVATKVWTVTTKAAALATKVWAAGQWLLNAALTANPIGLVIVGIVALGAAVVIAYKKSATFRKVVGAALDGVKKVAMTLFGWVKDHWPLLLVILTGPIGLAVVAIIKNFDKIKAGFGHVVDAAKAMGKGIGKAWDGIQNAAQAATRWVVDRVLWMAEKTLDAAVSAFGWAPKIGGQLKAARDKVRQFRADVNAELGGIKDEPVKVTVRAGVTSTAGLGLHGGPGTGLAKGGPVHGGVPGKDSVAAWLMPGEHVFTTEEVRKGGGHKAMLAIRRMLKRGEFAKRGDVPAFATGGPVFSASTSGASDLGAPIAALRERVAASLARKVEAQVKAILKKLGGEGSLSPSQIARGQRFARSQVGKPYVWSSAGPGGYDCSGFVSAVLNAAQGKYPYARRGSTGTMPWPGFKPGKGSFTAGWYTGSPGHMAGSIGGMGIESAGGVGVRIGGAATPVSSFPHVAHFDNGGMLEPGWTAAYNGTGRPEPIPNPRRSAEQPRELHVHVHIAGHALASKREIETVVTEALDNLKRKGRLN